MVIFYYSASPSLGVCPHSFLYKLLLSGCSETVITASCWVITKRTFLAIKFEGSRRSLLEHGLADVVWWGTCCGSPLGWRVGSGHRGAAAEGWGPHGFSGYSQLVQCPLGHSWLLLKAEVNSYPQSRLIFLLFTFTKYISNTLQKLKEGLILIP